jgi:hypothetical protein
MDAVERVLFAGFVFGLSLLAIGLVLSGVFS